jgi:type I restriction enzyme S subunit
MVGWHNKFNSEDSPVIGHIGAYAGIVNWASGKHFVTYNGVICKHKNDNVNKRYAYHLLLMQNFGEKAKGGSQPFVSYDALKKPLVPVPPLEVQCEIIHILDDFTLLSAELSAELKARQQQYDYYEKLLFDFDINNLKYKQMKFEDIATFSQGIQVDVNKQYYEPFDNCVPFLRIVDFVNKNEPPRYIEMPNEKYIKNEKEMIMIRYGASAAGKVFINKYGAIANNMFKINLKENCGVNLKYLMYYLSQKSIYNLLNNSGKSTMPAINFGFLGKLVINIPEKEEQDRIVKILDRFDKLCNDISEGLPAEIEKRQKQYEYYRDKLLTFKELKNE